MKTGVIILNYKNYNDTIDCIKSVERYNTAPIKYLIIDNGSNDNQSIENLDSFCSSNFKDKYLKLDKNNIRYPLSYISLIENSENLGYARGNNVALKIFEKDDEIDKILILNNDILFVENILPELIKLYNKLPDCGIISPILFKKNFKEFDYNCARRNIHIKEAIKNNIFHYYYRYKGGVNKKRYYLFKEEYLNKDFFKIELPSGSCMLIDKRLFKEIGYFDDNTFLYYEENILFKKIERLYKSNYLCTKLKCIHLGALSTSKTPGLFTLKCNIESSLYYMKQYSGCNNTLFLIYKLSCYFLWISVIIQKFVMRKKT